MTIPLRLTHPVFLLFLMVLSNGAHANAIDTCRQAVSQADDYMKASRQIALQRQARDPAATDYHAALLSSLAQYELPLTLTDCMNATAEKYAIYQCLASESGNVRSCLNHPS